MRFLGRKSSNNGPKAICRWILNKFNPSADLRSRYGRVEDGEWLAIPTKLVKLEDVATSNHMSLVELAMITVKNRQSKKCRTTLMISDTSVELHLNKQNLFAVGLDQIVTCFSLPSEPKAFALVYKKDGTDGYCCSSLMLNDALTSLSVHMGWEVWEILIRKQLFFTVRESNRRFTAQAQLTGNACHDTSSVSSLRGARSCTSIGSVTSSVQPSSVDSFSTSTLTSISSCYSLSTLPQSLRHSLSCISTSSSLTCSQQLNNVDSFSFSTLTSIASFDSLSSLDSKSLNTELDPMEQTSSSSSTSDSALLPSGTSVTFYQNGTDSLASKADCSCSGEDEEACFESGVASDDNSEAFNRSGTELMSISCCDFSEEIGDGISSESDLSAADEDAESETVVSAVCDVNIQPSPSVNLTGTSDVVTGNTTSVNLTNDSAGLHTETNNMMTYSESDSCSCSSCCCSCEECCNHESDSDVYMCYDSDSDTSSGEDTTDLDYDGDDEDDDGSMKCQPAARISNHYSNKILRLIRVQNVGLVVMAISKDSVSGRKSMEASSSLQMRMLKNLGKEIYFKRVPC